MADKNASSESRFDAPNARELMPRMFKDYVVSERELNTLGFLSTTAGFLLAVFGVAAGAAITLGVTLSTVDIPAGKTLMIYWGLFGASAFASLVLLVVCVFMTIRSVADVRAIKENSEQEKRRRELKESEASDYSSYARIPQFERLPTSLSSLSSPDYSDGVSGVSGPVSSALREGKKNNPY